MLRSPLARGSGLAPLALSARCQRPFSRPISFIAPYSSQQPSSSSSPRQVRHAHAISNPTLANIEKRWEQMPLQEQADLWTQLRDRMKVNWHELTLAEKKAAYWIAFGPHGPRAVDPPGTGWKVFQHVTLAFIVSGIVFAITRHFANPAPKTMTREYQEKSNEYLKEQRVEPITGISSEGYSGKFMVQSPPAAQARVKKDDEE